MTFVISVIEALDGSGRRAGPFVTGDSMLYHKTECLLGSVTFRSGRMALFNGRSSLLEVQNRALIKTARDRAAQIEKLEAELQTLRQQAVETDKRERELQGFREKAEQIEKLQRDLQTAQGRAERLTGEIERLTLERDFYCKNASALEEHNRQLMEAATKYSLWGQKLERELARIDPDGAPARQFGAQHES